MSEIETVAPTGHEFTVNYNYGHDGLTPYWATRASMGSTGGSRKARFKLDGERWIATLYHQESGIVHPGDETPQGTPFEFDRVLEPRLAIERHPDEDPPEKQSLNAHMRPRWQGMKVENARGQRSELSVPDEITEGVNVRVQGSNIAFQRYRRLVAEGFHAVDVNRRYFEKPVESNVQDAARYVRVDENRARPIHARDGPIASLGHLLENDRSGVRKVTQSDRDNDGEQVEGFYHTVTLGEKRVAEAFPTHTFPREIKHYKAREAKSLSENNPLSHPKIEVAYQVSQWNETISADHESVEELKRQLDETLFSVLADAGVPVDPRDPADEDGENDPWVSDSYFDPMDSAETEVVDIDLTRIRMEQESVVVRYLADGGFSPVEWETLDHAVTDGGKLSPKRTADEIDRHPDSVRRALRRTEQLFEREYGEYALRSNYIAEMVHDAVKRARESARTAFETGAKAIEASKRGLDEAASAFVAWAARHGVDPRDRGGEPIEIDFGTYDADSIKQAKREIRAALREGFSLWKNAGQDPGRFLLGEYKATVEYEIGGELRHGPAQRALSRTETQILRSRIGPEIS
ncbi:MarR family transcriptional regulator [Halovivax limisalsi]|uniref:DUF7845 domain-containing protein n=1 Tax=Halovivax limisalsi TaxID=1453760 RepID=UPI001FFCC54C|nr:MarR family transcriptional regulator [Halovivax limisalsi]